LLTLWSPVSEQIETLCNLLRLAPVQTDVLATHQGRLYTHCTQHLWTRTVVSQTLVKVVARRIQAGARWNGHRDAETGLNRFWFGLARAAYHLIQRIRIATHAGTNSFSLARFVQDSENVHTSPIQTTTQAVIKKLLERPVATDQQTLEEFIQACYSNEAIHKYPIQTITLCIGTVATDIVLTESGSVHYKDVFDRIWGVLRRHPNRQELLRRLLEETIDGIDTCGNGKLARLVNVLQGYDIVKPIRSNDAFQNRMVQIATFPLLERKQAALTLCREYKISPKLQEDWITYLLEE